MYSVFLIPSMHNQAGALFILGGTEEPRSFTLIVHVQRFSDAVVTSKVDPPHIKHAMPGPGQRAGYDRRHQALQAYLPGASCDQYCAL